MKNKMIKLPKTQYKIAQEMGVSKQAVNQWLSGLTLPTDDNLMKLATCLDMTLDEVLKLLEQCVPTVVHSDVPEEEVIQ